MVTFITARDWCDSPTCALRYIDVVTTEIEIGVVVKQVQNLDTTAMQVD
jgi:hypothetical protein